jgi:hypothetical protein
MLRAGGFFCALDAGQGVFAAWAAVTRRVYTGFGAVLRIMKKDIGVRKHSR